MFCIARIVVSFSFFYQRGNIHRSERKEESGMNQNVMWEQITVNGEETDALSMGDTANFLGISLTALNNRVKKLGLTRYQLGSKRYLVRSDIEKLRQARAVQ